MLTVVVSRRTWKLTKPARMAKAQLPELPHRDAALLAMTIHAIRERYGVASIVGERPGTVLFRRRDAWNEARPDPRASTLYRADVERLLLVQPDYSVIEVNPGWAHVEALNCSREGLFETTKVPLALHGETTDIGRRLHVLWRTASPDFRRGGMASPWTVEWDSVDHWVIDRRRGDSHLRPWPDLPVRRLTTLPRKELVHRAAA